MCSPKFSRRLARGKIDDVNAPNTPPPSRGETTPLQVSRALVEQACNALDELRDAIREAFAGLATGEAEALPKAALNFSPGHFFQAMVAADQRSDLAAVKWVAVAPQGDATTIHTSMMLSRRSTGELLATMDAAPITAARTAAMSAIAAQRMARPDSRSIAFIGCGTQARSHLAALKRVLPQLDHVLAYSRQSSTASAFADKARSAGFRAEIMDDARAAITRADVVVSAVGIDASSAPFLDANWLSPVYSSLRLIWLAPGYRRASRCSISLQRMAYSRASSLAVQDGCHSRALSTPTSARSPAQAAHFALRLNNGRSSFSAAIRWPIWRRRALFIGTRSEPRRPEIPATQPTHTAFTRL